MRGMAGLTGLAAAIAIVSSGSAVEAREVFDRLSGGTCYMRLYESAHLAKNPKQTITKFHVVALGNDPLKRSHPQKFTVAFNFWLKNAGYYDGNAACTTAGGQAVCNVEADGGSFTLATQGNQLRVTLGQRLEVEGQKKFSPNVATPDNRVMLLPAAPKGSCQQSR